MNILLVNTALTLAVCAAVAGAGASAGTTQSDIPGDLQSVLDVFYDAIERDDAETRIELLDEDVILLPNHWTMIEGKEAVSAVFRNGSTQVFRIKDREIVQAEVADGTAYTVNSYYYTYHEKDEDPQWHKTKNVHVWKRNTDGDWKLRIDIWNSDVPIEDFAQE
jgi:ketosteroid isomerase-like protein